MFGRGVRASAVVLALAGCGGGGGSGQDGAPLVPPAGSDVALSWDAARVYQPFSTSPITVTQLVDLPPAPVAIFLHGCTGLDSLESTGSSQDWALLLAQAGYLVIMPDSLARKSREGVLTCDPASYQRGMNMWIYDLRVEEANYAIARVLEAPWYDGKQLILGGFSEGAAVVYRATYDAPTHLIMSGFWCTTGVTKATSKQSIFYLNWSKDPWYYAGAPFDGARCLVPGYDIQSVTLEGAIHDGLGDSGARQAAAEFVRIHEPQVP